MGQGADSTSRYELLPGDRRRRTCDSERQRRQSRGQYAVDTPSCVWPPRETREAITAWCAPMMCKHLTAGPIAACLGPGLHRFLSRGAKACHSDAISTLRSQPHHPNCFFLRTLLDPCFTSLSPVHPLVYCCLSHSRRGEPPVVAATPEAGGHNSVDRTPPTSSRDLTHCAWGCSSPSSSPPAAFRSPWPPILPSTSMPNPTSSTNSPSTLPSLTSNGQRRPPTRSSTTLDFRLTLSSPPLR
jgi:hypothetical protein